MKKLTHFPRENGGMILRVVQVASPEVTAYGVYLPLFLTFQRKAAFQMKITMALLTLLVLFSPTTPPKSPRNGFCSKVSSPASVSVQYMRYSILRTILGLLLRLPSVFGFVVQHSSSWKRLEQRDSPTHRDRLGFHRRVQSRWHDACQRELGQDGTALGCCDG